MADPAERTKCKGSDTQLTCTIRARRANRADSLQRGKLVALGMGDEMQRAPDARGPNPPSERSALTAAHS